MEFILGAVKVLVGTFVLFAVAKISYAPLVKKSGWIWVAFVTVLAVLNMLVHRIIGSTINPPFYTAVWFAITLAGLTPRESPAVAPWHRRAIYGVVVGTIIGWGFYVEVVSAH
jgi:uncharacterized membrane protein